MLPLRMAVRSVIRRGFGLLLVIAPTTLLFGLLTFLLATESSMRQLWEPGMDTRGVRVGSVEGIKLERSWYSRAEVNSLFKPLNVEVAPTSWLPCGLDETSPYEFLCAIGTDTYIRMFDWEMHVPEEELTRWNATPNGTIITRAMANKHHWKVGDKFTLTFSWGGVKTPLPLVITFIVDRYLTDNFAWIHQKYVDDISNTTKPFWVVWLLVDKPENRPKVMAEVDARLNEIHRPHTLWTMEQSKELITGSAMMLVDAFRVAGAFSFVLILAVAVTLLILSIEQRTTEFATLCAIGFRRSVLAWTIIWEGALLLMPGALLGAAAVYFQFHDKPLMFNLIFRVHVHASDPIIVAVGGTLLGLLAGIIPAWRVSRIDVLSSLR